MPELFQRFGGHKQAAGLSLQTKDLEDFRRRFNLFATSKLSPDDFRPQYEIDAEASLSELTDRCAMEVLSLGPFGFGNPPPLLRCLGVEVAGPPREMNTGKHLTVALRQDARTLFCKAWNLGHLADCFEPGTRLDVLLQIEDDPYSRKRGYGSWCLSLKDFRISEKST